ncbi:hypothetical protein Trihar35433_4041 [Trichoderma harzianum]|nr:hypothetical protein Trihar35433_4041 [Trichoderma harzianum]
MSSKIVLILGYGQRIGAAVARAFASRGYKVAVVCRSDKVADTPDDYLSIKADLSNAYNVEDVFTQVRSKLGIPSVVVYNEPLISMGMGKSASAHMIHYLSEVYRSSGYKFYHTDERESNGEPAYDKLDAEAHSNYYVELAEGKDQGPWNATFVKGKGYVKFDETPIHGGRFPGA